MTPPFRCRPGGIVPPGSSRRFRITLAVRGRGVRRISRKAGSSGYPARGDADGKLRHRPGPRGPDRAPRRGRARTPVRPLRRAGQRPRVPDPAGHGGSRGGRPGGLSVRLARGRDLRWRAGKRAGVAARRGTQPLDRPPARAPARRAGAAAPARGGAGAGLAENVEEGVEGREWERLCRAAIAELPEDQRRALELAYFDGPAQQEIAERTDTPLGTVKTRVRLGLMKLRDRIRPYLPEGRDALITRRSKTWPRWRRSTPWTARTRVPSGRISPRAARAARRSLPICARPPRRSRRRRLRFRRGPACAPRSWRASRSLRPESSRSGGSPASRCPGSSRRPPRSRSSSSRSTTRVSGASARGSRETRPSSPRSSRRPSASSRAGTCARRCSRTRTSS